MKKIYVYILIFTASIFSTIARGDAGLNAISKDAIKGQLEFLASDWTEGRETGTKGEYIAADYIASLFQVYGLKPAGDIEIIYPDRSEQRRGAKVIEQTTFFQNFNLVEYQATDNQHLALKTNYAGSVNTIEFGYKTDFSVNVSGLGISIESPIVFVGYGISDEKNGYDDYKGLDVRGKIVVRLTGFPGHADTNSVAYKKFKSEGRYWRYAINRKKNETATEKGVAAIIEINLIDNPADMWASNIPFRYNTRFYEGEAPLNPRNYKRMEAVSDSIVNEPVVINVSKRAAYELLKNSGIDIASFEKQVVTTLKPISRPLKDKTLIVKTEVNSRIIKARNVVGMIEGEDPNDVIVIGAHYDHLGMRNGYIYNGADDNASGTVGVMTIAKACMATGVKPKKTIIFAAWTAEEKGLIGSEYFVNTYKTPSNIKLYLNYDMISRNESTDSAGNKCAFIYTKAYPQLESQNNEYIKKYGFKIQLEYEPSERPSGGSDHSPFAQKDIPIFYYFAAMHDDYHQPFDHTSKTNWDKMLEIIKLGYLTVWENANIKGNLPK